MRRFLLVPLLALVVLGAVPAGAEAVEDVGCHSTWTVEPDLAIFRAGPIVETTDARSVDLTCELRLDEPDGLLVSSITQRTLGPVAMLANVLTFTGVQPRHELWWCTYTIPHPTNVRRFYGCNRMD